MEKIILAIQDRSIFKKARHKIKSSLFILLVKLSLFINYPKLTALIFMMIASKVNRRGDFTVLCLGRSVFLNDIEALANFGGRIKYVVIFKNYFRMIFDYFLTESERNQLTEENYHICNLAGDAKRKYNLYLSQMIPALRRLIKFDAVLSGNFGYPEQQELEDVCTKNGIPFIILHKEGLLVPGYGKEWADLFKVYKFRGAEILFYSNEIRRALLNNSLSGISENNTKIVGMPRFDYYFTMPKKEKKYISKQVVCFSSDPDDRLLGLFIKDDNKIKEIRDRFYNFHKSVIKFAADNKNIKVIIKTKFAGHYFQYVKQILADNFKDPIDNLVITNIGDTLDLIKNSIAVISFNSTTCLEALIFEKVLISPYFGDLITDKPWDYFSEHPELVNYIKTETDLEKYIFNSDLYTSHDMISKKKLFKDLLGNSDGQSSVRAENEIIKIIQKFQHPT
ncbi:MAG: hypothetical protein HZC14_00130 [Candidatus Niyogibacteria bacterium]|nr:hypothetical protein [Candidatus Niyogibacteria bacterium]